jgi:hypothetical protein
MRSCKWRSGQLQVEGKLNLYRWKKVFIFIAMIYMYMLLGVSDKSVCPWHNGKCAYVRVSVCVCVIPVALFQVEFRVLVYPTSRQSRCCPEAYPASHSLRDPHCWRVSQETLGRLGLFACFTLSHTPFRTLCRLCWYHNSLPPRVSSPRVPWKRKFLIGHASRGNRSLFSCVIEHDNFPEVKRKTRQSHHGVVDDLGTSVGWTESSWIWKVFEKFPVSFQMNMGPVMLRGSCFRLSYKVFLMSYAPAVFGINQRLIGQFLFDFKSCWWAMRMQFLVSINGWLDSCSTARGAQQLSNSSARSKRGVRCTNGCGYRNKKIDICIHTGTWRGASLGRCHRAGLRVLGSMLEDSSDAFRA